MKMSLVITGVTLMQGDNRCISGYNLFEKRYYRPCLSGSHWLEDDLRVPGNEIDVFREVTFDVCNKLNPSPPHIEDINVSKNTIISRETTVGSGNIEFLHQIADNNIIDIYGDYIENYDNHFVVPLGFGKRSLGTIIARKCKTTIDSKGKTRVDIIDQAGYEIRNIPCVARDDKYRPIGSFEEVPVRLSLTRAWNREGRDEKYYWLQCSGVFI